MNDSGRGRGAWPRGGTARMEFLKETTPLPSALAQAGIPYQVFGDRAGTVAVSVAWTRPAIAPSQARQTWGPAALNSFGKNSQQLVNVQRGSREGRFC